MPTAAAEAPVEPRMRIAIVAHFAFGALSGAAGGHIGGVERQVTMMARWLAAHGHEIVLVTWDEGQPDDVVIDGVRVVKVCAQDAGLPVLRFVHPRWTSLWRALRRADADIYYQNCGEYVTGQVALWCRLHGRAFVYSSASDADCDVRLPLMPERRVRALYRLGLRLADRMIVQTTRQQRMVQEGFHRSATVIPMPCQGPGAATHSERPDTVLWVGRICRVKRPDRFIELARACPDLRFVLAGPPDDTAEYVRTISEQAAGVSNLEMWGPADRAALDLLFGAAICLCCTSDHEGFPNTFLESWSHGCPVVTTWDPDNIIDAHGLGVVATDVAGLAAGIRSLSEATTRRAEIAAAATKYFAQHHDERQVMPRFEQVFADCRAVGKRGLRRAALAHRVAG